MVAYYRRKDQLSRSKENSSNPEVGGRSFSATLNALLGLDDYCMFGVCLSSASFFFLFLFRMTHSFRR